MEPEKEQLNKDIPAVEPAENHELGIKRVRTYAEDLALAKEKAGIVEEAPKKKSGGLFGTRKKKAPAPATTPNAPVAPQQNVHKKPEQPSKEFIERELARSGIVTQDSVEKEEVEEVASSLSPIRTYKYDAAESIQEKGTSRISMVAAEQKRRVENKDFSNTFSAPKDPSSPLRNALFVVLSLALVGGGIWGGFHFYNKSQVDSEPAVVVQKNILFTNDSIERDASGISGKDFVNLMSAATEAAKGRTNDLIEIELKDKKLFGDDKLSKDSFFRALDGSASGQFVRSLGVSYVVGVHSGLGNSRFYLFKIEDFDTAFAGMLEWEEFMHLNLYGDFEGGPFVDEFIKNKDTRVQRDRFGNTKLIYAFPNSETLIITQNEAAFFELFDRLTVSNATRN